MACADRAPARARAGPLSSTRAPGAIPPRRNTRSVNDATRSAWVSTRWRSPSELWNGTVSLVIAGSFR
jgi:hypothetical protein